MARAIRSSEIRSEGWSWGRTLRQIIFYGGLLAIWQLLVSLNIWPSYLFPSPVDVLRTFISGVQDGTFLRASAISLGRLALGYVISLIIGLTLGVFIGRNRYASETLGTLVLGLQALPSVCWVPIALLWFGLSEQAMLFVVVMGALFSITLGVEAGVRNTPPVYIKAARNMGASGFALARQVILPAALPSILTGLKQGWSFAWRSLMAAELIYVTVSLGGLLDQGRNLNDTSLLIAVMAVIIILGVTIDSLVFKPLENRVRERWGLNR